MCFFSSLSDLISAYREKDPATSSSLEILLLYPGVRAWILYRIAHSLHRAKIPFVPRLLTETGRLLSGIDIHPGAQIGERVVMDHGMGIVIGETAIIGNDVLIYQGVTLGGTSLERQKRHPSIGDHCVIGAGAKVLGNIQIGADCRIGANSVVVKDVPPSSTVVGIPGRIVASEGIVQGQELDHGKLPDPILQKFIDLEKRLLELERS